MGTKLSAAPDETGVPGGTLATSPQRFVQIGNLTFDRVRYDRDGDVLYLHRADPKDAVEFDASPEGHALRFNAAGKLIGVTIVNARWLLEHEGKITITIPERLEVEAAALGEALTAA